MEPLLSDKEIPRLIGNGFNSECGIGSRYARAFYEDLRKKGELLTRDEVINALKVRRDLTDRQLVTGTDEGLRAAKALILAEIEDMIDHFSHEPHTPLTQQEP